MFCFIIFSRNFLSLFIAWSTVRFEYQSWTKILLSPLSFVEGVLGAFLLVLPRRQKIKFFFCFKQHKAEESNILSTSYWISIPWLSLWLVIFSKVKHIFQWTWLNAFNNQFKAVNRFVIYNMTSTNITVQFYWLVILAGRIPTLLWKHKLIVVGMVVPLLCHPKYDISFCFT